MAGMGMMQPQIILLKDGTDTSQGKPQLISNINACLAVVDTIRTTLGPRGMDKLIHDERGNTTISNDGATILKLLEIVHPAAKTLVDIARSQDDETLHQVEECPPDDTDTTGRRVPAAGQAASLAVLFLSHCFPLRFPHRPSFPSTHQVGDGTTTVTLLAGEFLRQAKPFVEDGVHPQLICRAFRAAARLAVEKVREVAISIEGKGDEEKRELLHKCAATTLSSKLVGGEKDFFARMVVDAVCSLDEDVPLHMIGIKKVCVGGRRGEERGKDGGNLREGGLKTGGKSQEQPCGTMRDSFLVEGVAFKKTFSYAGFEQQPKRFESPKIPFLNIELELESQVPGGTMRDSFLVEGVAFKKTFSYAGFEQQPKRFESPKILLLNIELELKSEKENAEVRLSDPSQYQSIVDAEWNIIYSKLDKCVQSGAKIVLSRLAIGDLATQYFADRDIFCAGRVAEDDMHRVAKATGGAVQTTVNDLIPDVLGSCALFEERQVGNERYNLFTGCSNAKTATIVLRGGADQVGNERHNLFTGCSNAKTATIVLRGGADQHGASSSQPPIAWRLLLTTPHSMTPPPHNPPYHGASSTQPPIAWRLLLTTPHSMAPPPRNPP
ncbi:unnamed protein product [Closterium sp. NIES-64]|nr:unnamed protein product [Closterium sp. NIES-64]